MATKLWYVLNTLTGQEQKAKRYLDTQAKNQEFDDFIAEVIMPTEKVSETKQNKKKTVVRKFFPGYLLINIALYDDDKQFNTPLFRFVTDAPGVIGFLGGDTPVALTEQEVKDVFAQLEEKRDSVRPKVVYEAGEMVTILEGAFKGSNGPIDEIDPDRGKMKVTVTIFGRPVAVELEYWQVERFRGDTATGVHGS